MDSTFILSIIVLLLAARIGGAMAKRIGQSAVLGEILAGILVGSAILGQYLPLDFSSAAVINFADIGIALLMFLIGIKLDLKTFEKYINSGFASAFLGVMFPFVFSVFIAFNVLGWNPMQSIILGGILMATSVGVTGRMLIDTKMVRTRVGLTILDAAIVENIIAVVILTFLLGLVTGTIVSPVSFLIASIKILAFFIFIVLVGQKAGRYIVQAGKMLNLRVKEGLLSAGLILIFLLAYFAEVLGLSMIIGAFLAGVILDEKHLLKIEHEIYSMAYGLFRPIFFAYIGTLVDPQIVYTNFGWILIIFLIAVVTKVFGAGMGAKISGIKPAESLLVGIGMIPRGEVALVLTGLAARHAIFDSNLYSTVIAVIVLTMLITPPLFKQFVRKITDREF